MASVTRGQELLRRQFEEGPLSQEEDRELQALLKESETLRALYQKYVRLERSLEGREVPLAQIERMLARGAPLPKPEEASNELAPQVEESASTLQRKPSSRPRLWWVGGSTLVAAAAAFALFVLDRKSPEFLERSGQSGGRQGWISIYQPSDRGLQKVTTSAEASQPFAFAYTHLQKSPYRFLAIVGRDADGRIHWFHPEYVHKSDRPSSIAIETGVADQELGALIRIAAPAGSMELCGLFTRSPLDVVREDQRLEKGEAWPEGLRDCRTLLLQ